MNKKRLVKQMIAVSMENLLQTTKLEDITVGDILNKADISRTTFYRYFEDKYALVNWIYSQYLEELTEKYQEVICFQWLMYDLTTFLKSKKSFFLRIIQYTGQNSFDEYFLKSTTEFLTSNLKKIRNMKQLEKEDRYMVSYNAAGTVRIVLDWLNGGCLEEPKELTAYITLSMSEKLREHFVRHPDYGYEPPQ